MEETARALVAPGKGVLAADESTPTMAKRLRSIGLESTEPLRRAYREILFTTDGLSEHIGGVILYDETVGQRDRDGTPFPDLLQRRGIVPGIKVDGGTRPLAGFPGEVATQGLDGLRERLEDYAAPRSPVRQVAGRDPHRRRATDRRVRRGERPRARPLRIALPGGRADAHRRARGADGRATRPGDLCATSPNGCSARSTPS